MHILFKDLQEAESELVAGFFTEHSSIIFVFFFLAEYSSIVLFSAITAILFFGGYNLPELFINNSDILYPPKKNITVIQENSTIELYSAKKKKTKGTLECSVKKPATNSDSKIYLAKRY